MSEFSFAKITNIDELKTIKTDVQADFTASVTGFHFRWSTPKDPTKTRYSQTFYFRSREEGREVRILRESFILLSPSIFRPPDEMQTLIETFTMTYRDRDFTGVFEESSFSKNNQRVYWIEV